jgi:hypothetical protein
MSATNDPAAGDQAVADAPARENNDNQPLAITTTDDIKRLYEMVIELEGYRRCREEVSGALNVEVCLQGELYDPSVKIDVRRAMTVEIDTCIAGIERRLTAYGIRV